MDSPGLSETADVAGAELRYQCRFIGAEHASLLAALRAPGCCLDSVLAEPDNALALHGDDGLPFFAHPPPRVSGGLLPALRACTRMCAPQKKPQIR